MAKKKTPPEYGLSPYSIRQLRTRWTRLSCPAWYVDMLVKESKSNVLVPLLLLASETAEEAFISWWLLQGPECHGRCDNQAILRTPTLFLRPHTRSSPIGPAEHEEGGSLSRHRQYQSTPTGKLNSRLKASTIEDRIADIPAKICQLLIDTFQSHGL